MRCVAMPDLGPLHWALGSALPIGDYVALGSRSRRSLLAVVR
jgi:hypothetical protein